MRSRYWSLHMHPGRSHPKKKSSRRPARVRRRPWLYYALIGLIVCAAGLTVTFTYYYLTFSQLIDVRLHRDRQHAEPRIFGRPLILRQGQLLSLEELVARLNDMGYAQRAPAAHPREFEIREAGITLVPGGGDVPGRHVRITIAPASASPAAASLLRRLEVVGAGTRASLTLERPLIASIPTVDREKRRHVPLALISRRLIEAVLAIEDRRFYDHPGIDPIRIVAALVTNVRGDRPYLVGGSTLTQQLVKNLFLTHEKTLRRKLLEQFFAMVLEQHLTKDQILELYLNEVYVGHRDSFAVHGVAEAARLFFGKNVTNVSLAEAATIAGVIQSPQVYSPFKHSDRALERRNVVLAEMVRAGFISSDAAAHAVRAPLGVPAATVQTAAPHFVDFVTHVLAETEPDLPRGPVPLDIHTTIDLHMQLLAQEAVERGLARLDATLTKRGGPARHPEAALIAVDPRTGDILAFVGGRSYSQSQFNRVANARRQPGSVFKPFVYLAAFEQAVLRGKTDLTPATIVNDQPTRFATESRTWAPANYGAEYDGPITLRRALAFSRNNATIKVAERAGYDQVANFWRRIGAGTPPRAYPSIALGVFEATPLEIAQAYTIFPNLGKLRPLRPILQIVRGGTSIRRPRESARRMARPDTAFLVTNMMRSVLTEGTGASARAAGFIHDAAGKSGTTNELRDGWFVGFTPDLLTVVWVGLDDNRPLGVSGSQAALPIWTTFMMQALAGRPTLTFDPPEGIRFVDIDRDTGLIALPGCPNQLREAFLAGTEPGAVCELHRF